MNAYYNDFTARNANVAAPRRRTRTAADIVGRMLSFIDYLLALLSRPSVATVARVVVTTLCFFGFIGVIGGIEADKLSWPAGFAIVAALSAVEYACLRKIKK